MEGRGGLGPQLELKPMLSQEGKLLSTLWGRGRPRAARAAIGLQVACLNLTESPAGLDLMYLGNCDLLWEGRHKEGKVF